MDGFIEFLFLLLTVLADLTLLKLDSSLFSNLLLGSDGCGAIINSKVAL